MNTAGGQEAAMNTAGRQEADLQTANKFFPEDRIPEYQEVIYGENSIHYYGQYGQL